ncbi:isochorismatase [Acinetobacter defluvii]|uniref:cysteine hydrolase family protein n=1 Tax=Acinetobacter defluvii TaxID=1871111 RepID=UPI00149072BB|nr:cysteine hydrolase family protein [Acinetobacter defluvii]NNP73286.1 isochorismatase [Acinetobacter defluvii]
MNQTALLVIDVQNDYFPDGKMALFQPEKALTNISILEKEFHLSNAPIIYIQHIFAETPAPFFEKNTEGVKLHPNLAVQDHSFIVEKAFPNSFFQTDLQTLLSRLGIQKLVITGMMTHMCVDATTRAAAELGYQSIVISDATATRDLSYVSQTVQAIDVQTAFLSAFQMFAQVHSTAFYLSTLISSEKQ